VEALSRADAVMDVNIPRDIMEFMAQKGDPGEIVTLLSANYKGTLSLSLEAVLGMMEEHACCEHLYRTSWMATSFNQWLISSPCGMTSLPSRLWCDGQPPARVVPDCR
jgi:hypothetical protein